MKKIISLLLAVMLLLSLCACGGNKVGKYKSVGLFLDYECELHEDTTFDIVGENYNEPETSDSAQQSTETPTTSTGCGGSDKDKDAWRTSLFCTKEGGQGWRTIQLP